MTTPQDDEIIYFMQEVYETLDEHGNRRGILDFFQLSKEEQLENFAKWQTHKEEQRKQQLKAQRDSLKKQLDELNKKIGE